MADGKFVDGVSVFGPRPGAPDFVKGALVIDVDRAIESLKALAHAEKGKDGVERNVVRLDLKESKDGKLYAQVNDFKKEGKSKSDDAPGGSSGPSLPF